MEPRARARLASVGVLFLVFVTGFLLGMAWDRTDGTLEAGEADGDREAVARVDGGSTDADAQDEAGARDDSDTPATEREDRDDDRDRDRRGDRDRDDDPRDRDDDRDGRRLIVHDVGITQAQEARVDSIVDLHRDRVRELRREMEEAYEPRFRQLRREMEAEYDPRMREVLLETRSSIRTVLTEEQATRYDSLLAEHDRKEEERKKDRR